MVRYLAPLIVGLCFGSSALLGQPPPYFHYDFEDGVVPETFEDGVFGCASCEIDNGSYVIPRSSGWGVNSIVMFEPDDFMIDTQIRFTANEGKTDIASIFVRDSARGDGFSPGYFASIDTTGALTIQQQHDVGNHGRSVSTHSGIDPFASDVRLRFIVDASVLSLYAWEDGRSIPNEPQLQMIDEMYRGSSYIAITNSSFSAAPGATLSVRFFEASPVLVGDFDANGQIGVEDIDLLSRALQDPQANPYYDINEDSVLDTSDLQFTVNVTANTWLGDTNLDGEFNSGDLVAVFQAGEYEDAVEYNSTWADGDWNADLDFDSSDLVVAFTEGGYEQGPHERVNVVPEPTSLAILIAGLIGIAIPRRYRQSQQLVERPC